MHRGRINRKSAGFVVSPATGCAGSFRGETWMPKSCVFRAEAALRWIVLPPLSSVLNGSIAHRFLTVAARFGGSFRLDGGVAPGGGTRLLSYHAVSGQAAQYRDPIFV